MNELGRRYFRKQSTGKRLHVSRYALPREDKPKAGRRQALTDDDIHDVFDDLVSISKDGFVFSPADMKDGEKVEAGTR